MEKSPPQPSSGKQSRRARLFKTLWKTLGPEHAIDKEADTKEEKEETEDLDVLFEADGQIKAATLEKIVERITHDSFTSDPSLLLDLLVTHKSFTTSEELLAALIHRFKEHAVLNTAGSVLPQAHLTRSGSICSPVPTRPRVGINGGAVGTGGIAPGTTPATGAVPPRTPVAVLRAQHLAASSDGTQKDSKDGAEDGEEEEEEGVPQIVPSLLHYKIYNVLRSWVDRQWYDFEPEHYSMEKGNLLATLTVFVQQTMPAAGMPELSQQLFHLISAKKFGAGEPPVTVARAPPPKPLLPLPSAELEAGEGLTSTPFWLYQPKEIARQITLMEHAVFSRIQPNEFLNQAWNKKAEAYKAPGILAAIRQFNSLSSWAMSEILRAESLNLRVEAIIRLIDIAMNCYALNNFNTMMALLAAFHSSPVHRLKKSFEALPPRDQTNLEWLSKLMAYAKNYSVYREHLKKIDPPCIPYLGIYLTDLTFVDEGNSAMTGGLINFSKYRKLGGLIREVMQLKSGTYSLTPVESVQRYLKKYEAMNEAQAYSVSLQIEPRTKDSRPEGEEDIEFDGHNIRRSMEVVSKEAWAMSPSASVRAGDSDSRFVLNLAVDPVPLMVVLPGSTGPVLVRVPPTCTAKLAIKRFSEFFNGISEGHTLVIMPNRTSPCGYVIEDDALLKAYAIPTENAQAEHIIGVYADPQPIRVCYYYSNISDPIVMLLDYGTPLSSIVSTFQAVFKVAEDFTFFRYSLENQSVQWLSMNRSLSEMQFSLKDHVLFLFSIPLLFARKPNSESIKSGYMFKRSKKANTIRKMTPIKKRWFVLIDRFLLYFKSKGDSRPVSVVSLDHHVPRMGHRKGGLCLFIERTCEAFPKPSAQAIYYVLTSEDELDLRAWFRTMRKNCGHIGDEPIFGVDMEEVASRPSSKSRIPSIITKTISFLYNSALSIEGLFKQPGSNAIVDQLKKQFDLGINVEFSHATDPLAVASLLVLYLETLPGPLTTYDLYTQFLACGATLAPTDEIAANKLRSLVSMLPLSNISVLHYLLTFLAHLASENPIGTKGVSEVFTSLVIRPHLEYTLEQGEETPENVFEKLLSLHDLIFNGLVESITKQQNIVATPRVPEVEDVLARELSLIIENQIIDRRLVVLPVSRTDMKFSPANTVRYSQKPPSRSSPPHTHSPAGSRSSSPAMGNSTEKLSLALFAHVPPSPPVHSLDSSQQPPRSTTPQPKPQPTRSPSTLQLSQEVLPAPSSPKATRQHSQSPLTIQSTASTKAQTPPAAQTTITQDPLVSPQSTLLAQNTPSPPPPPKVHGTVFGTHRLRPNVEKYSASAPMPPSIQTIVAPTRAHNNTSPAAVDTRREDSTTNASGEEVVHADGASADASSRDSPLQTSKSGCTCGKEPNKIDKFCTVCGKQIVKIVS